MKCPKCANDSPDDAAYCQVCYEVLAKKPPAKPAPAPVPARVLNPAAAAFLVPEPAQLASAPLRAISLWLRLLGTGQLLYIAAVWYQEHFFSTRQLVEGGLQITRGAALHFAGAAAFFIALFTAGDRLADENMRESRGLSWLLKISAVGVMYNAMVGVPQLNQPTGFARSVYYFITLVSLGIIPIPTCVAILTYGAGAALRRWNSGRTSSTAFFASLSFLLPLAAAAALAISFVNHAPVALSGDRAAAHRTR